MNDPALAALAVTLAHLIALFPCIPFSVWSVRSVTHSSQSASPACFIEAFGFRIFRLGLLYALADVPLVFLRAYAHLRLPRDLSLYGPVVVCIALGQAALAHVADSRRIQEQSLDNKKSARPLWQPLFRGLSLSVAEHGIATLTYCLMLSAPAHTVAQSLHSLIGVAFMAVFVSVYLSHPTHVQRVTQLAASADRAEPLNPGFNLSLSLGSTALPRLLLHFGMLMQRLAWIYALVSLLALDQSLLEMAIRLKL